MAQQKNRSKKLRMVYLNGSAILLHHSYSAIPRFYSGKTLTYEEDKDIIDSITKSLNIATAEDCISPGDGKVQRFVDYEKSAKQNCVWLRLEILRAIGVEDKIILSEKDFKAYRVKVTRTILISIPYRSEVI